MVKFLKCSKHIYWKTSFTEGLNSAPFLQNKVSQLIDRGGYFPKCDEPRGLPPVKINGIIEKLCPFMGHSRREFWKGIKSNDDSEDLALVRGFDDNDMQS